ncbi:MAG: TetR/AcrR family transcriptional regulator [Weeksellaceae bacterium]|nr:TetR/AcrR family transcriptional regulator [Weeksellaceae bacterium]
MTREYIIEKSTAMFLQHGFKTVTMDNVAEELSVSKKTLYEIFGNKDSLIEDVMRHNLQTAMSKLSEISTQAHNAVEEMYYMQHYFNHHFDLNQRSICIYQLKRYYPKIYKQIFETSKKDFIQFIAQNLQRGKTQKLYREPVYTELYSAWFFESKTYFVDQLEKESKFSSEEISFTLFDTFMRGICTPEGLDCYLKLNTPS